MKGRQEQDESNRSTLQKKVAALRDQAAETFDWVPRTASSGPRRFDTFESRIEHTLLTADATNEALDRLCREASEFGFRAVCCLPRDVPFCRKALGRANVLLVTVLNFPLGGSRESVVEAACLRALDDGADEVDMVAPMRALKAGDFKAVRRGVAGVVRAAGGQVVCL